MQEAPTVFLEQFMGEIRPATAMTAEQFRVLHARLEQLRKTRDQKVFCITSAVQGEGKTFTAVNLALTMAKDFGKKTLLMDLDCKKAIAQKLQGNGKWGGTGWVEVALGHAGLQEALVPLISNLLFLLPVGKINRSLSNPITTKGFCDLVQDGRKQFDYIVMDAPPVLSLADVQLLEDLVDGIILVVRAGATKRDAVLKAHSSLRREKILGLVLNDVKKDPMNYYYSNYYSSS